MAREVEKLEDVQIRHWIRAGNPVAKADGNGLTFTLSAAGAATWVLRYRFGGKARELTLGRYPDLSLTAARTRAKKERAKIQEGVDVAAVRQQTLRTAMQAQTVRSVATDYMAKRFPLLSAATVSQRRHHIEDLILPRIGGLRIKDVSPEEIVHLLESLSKSGKSAHVVAVTATALNEIFKHAQARRAVATNPCTGINPAAITGKPPAPRQRIKLSEDELRIILRELPTIGESNALAVKILLATATRINELNRAKWSDVDLERGLWTIPPEISKTRTGFVVPLVPAVVEWFERLRLLACGSDFVLPARTRHRARKHGGDWFSEQRAINAMLHKLCDRHADKVRRFSPHDLRSTARSYFSDFGVAPIVAERCLNHTLGGMLRIYDQHDYLEERRAALATWTDFLQACESGQAWQRENVIPLHRKSA